MGGNGAGSEQREAWRQVPGSGPGESSSPAPGRVVACGRRRLQAALHSPLFVGMEGADFAVLWLPSLSPALRILLPVVKGAVAVPCCRGHSEQGGASTPTFSGRAVGGVICVLSPEGP